MEKLEVKIKDNKIYSPIRYKWLDIKPEERVRQKFVCKLINDYGYSLDQMSEEVKLTTSQRGTGRALADLVVWKSKKDKESNKTAFLVCEFKAENLSLKVEDCYQGYNYATWSRAKLFAISNGRELQVYKTIEDELPLNLQQVNNIPYCKDITNSKKLEEFLSKTKEFTGKEFSNLLHKCHNIIRNNDKLSPEASFDEISKILFIKIMYERNPKQNAVFSLKQFDELKSAWNLSKGSSEKENSYMQRLFEDVKEEFANDGIFEENEKIKVREKSFESIVKELEIYNLTNTSSDVKGIAFERFLGRTFRGELGQFFTPRVIVDFVINLLDIKENELVCDPCAGSGGFLIKAFETINNEIEKEYIEQKREKQKEIFGNKLENIDNEELNKNYNVWLDEINSKQKERVKSLSTKQIFGTDANPRMARVSKMNMIMHGDGHSGIHHHDGLLNVNGIFRNRFDVIITNPPFGTTLNKDSTVEDDDRYTNKKMIERYKELYGDGYEDELKQVTGNIGKPIRDLFKVGANFGQTEVLFIERCLDLLKPDGRMGIVLPEGVLNGSNLQKARDYFESRAKLLLIVSLPSEVFLSSGATVKTSLVFLKKHSEAEQSEYDEFKSSELKKLEQRDLLVIKNKYKNELEKLLKNEEENSKKIKDIEKEKDREFKGGSSLREAEVKEALKIKFNYKIAISDIKKAGINSVGDKDTNELDDLLVEFQEYNKKAKLW